MRREPHPISGFIYEEIGDGTVRVKDPVKDRYGLFKWDGSWVEGDVTHADIHFLRYIGGPNLPEGRDIFERLLPVFEEAEASAGEIAKETSGFGSARMGDAAADMPRIVGKYVQDPGRETPQGARSAGHFDLDFFLKADRKPELIPEVYRLENTLEGGPMKVDTARFVDPAWHDMEVERIWKKTWQMVCREDDIPNIGDYHVYQIAHLSYLVVRTGENKFRAHENVCKHRGRTLRECSGKQATEFRCPYHGWSWKIDGSLKEITTEWDFPGVREDVGQLKPAKLATWAGFVFINPDPDAEPLEEFLGPIMMAHYERFNFAGRWKQVHVSRIMHANWKVVMEAFMDAYHVIATHPQLMLTAGDGANIRYDNFGNWSRAAHLSPLFISPQRGIVQTPEEVLADFHGAADGMKEFLRGIIGDEVENYCDAELTDGNFNDLFPNLHPWGGWARMVFRFRPNGSNHRETIMDIIYLSPWPKDRPKPPAAQERRLGPDESWTNAPELGTFARIVDQDCDNVAHVQNGLTAKHPGHVWYSNYQESKIRNFHRNYNKWMELDPS